ncbi:hypothetical protein PHISCL_01610 [Aspergillus sclerotialis]|uniref:Uncharacterized protein n=1 Tax=Aspergillus sclerotialis TaxID=2070753 RepID=A0A3A3A7Z1_9EURO|nr:hypothetical protein PHISCL_01610 [Aspergillus sclerotialis]
MARSPKLLSPPISRRESSFSGQIPLEKSQADYLGQFDGHNGWIESHHNMHGRPSMNPGSVRSFGGGIINSLPNSIPGALDSFAGDLPVPSSHINYSSGFSTAHGSSGHREF